VDFRFARHPSKSEEYGVCRIFLRFSELAGAMKGFSTPGQLLQGLHKRGILGPSVGVEEIEFVWYSVMIGLLHCREKVRFAIPPARTDSRFGRILMQREGAHCRGKRLLAVRMEPEDV